MKLEGFEEAKAELKGFTDRCNLCADRLMRSGLASQKELYDIYETHGLSPAVTLHTIQDLLKDFHNSGHVLK